MNEEAITAGYEYFVKTGYDGTIEEYKELLNTNSEAVNATFKYFVDTGYNGTVNEFVTLMGVGEKKNLVGPPTGEEEVMVSDTEVEVEEPGTSEPSLQTNQDPIVEQQLQTENLISPETFSLEADASVESSDDNTGDFFEQSLQKINADLIDEEEQTVVPLMNYHFKDYGFEFETTGLRDAMKVTAANDKSIIIDLDPATGNLLGFESKGADKLTQFLKENREESNQLNQIEKGYIQKRQKIQTVKGAEEAIKTFQKETQVVRDDISNYIKAKSFYDQNNLQDRDPNEIIYVEGPDGNQMSTTPLQLKENILKEEARITQAQENLVVKGKQLDEHVGEWYDMRSDQGGIWGSFWNALLDGTARVVTQNVNRLIDLGTFAGPLEGFVVSPQTYKRKVLMKAKEAGVLGDTYTDERIEEILKNPEEFERIKQIIKNAVVTETTGVNPLITKDGVPQPTSTTTSLLDDIEKEIRDEARKEVKYDRKAGEERVENPFSRFANDPRYDQNKGMLEMTRKGLRETVGYKDVTPEYTAETKKGFWGGALIGVTESIPAMLGPTPIRVVNMISQVEDHINEEMENDPDFDNVSEAEKAMFTIPLGIVVGVLENVGLRNALAQKGVASKILLRVYKRHGKNITGKSFREVVKKEVNSMIGQGLLVVGAGGLAEFETGLAQEMADIGFKEAYNAIKEKDMFRTPEDFYEGAKQVLRAGAQEMIGGFVIGTAPAVAVAASNGDFTTLDKGVFEMFEEIHNEPIVRDAFVEKTKERILKNELTKEEAEKLISDYDKTVGVMNQIPSDLPTAQKKKLLGNLLRQQELNSEIELYNKQLTKKQQAELLQLENEVEGILREGDVAIQQEKTESELNTQAINELKEEGIENPTPEQIKTKRDAIQESSPESVDVQVQTQDGGAVGDGNTQTTITEESSQEEQTDLDPTTQKEVEDLTSIINEQTGVQEETETETTTQETTTKGVEVDSENNNVTIEKSDGTKVTLPGVSVSENVSVTETAGDPTAVRIQNSLLRQAKNAGKAIAKLIPQANIVVHATEDAYNQAVSAANKGTRGTFSTVTNTIHINAPKANTRTVAHEVMHAVLLKKLGINADFSKVTGRMLKAVSKGIKDPQLKKTIEAFAADYDTKEQNEEQVSELFGYLSAAYTKLDGPTKSIVKRWLQKAAKAVGLPVNITEFTKEEADMIDFFNTVSKKVREGTEVTEGDIEVIPGEVVEDAEGPVPENIPDDGPSIDLEKTEKAQTDRGGIDLKKIKRGSINDLSGVNAFVFAADQATYGNIESPSGTKFMFNGGYLYPYGSESQGSNAAWVFANETAANKVLNKAKESDGVGLVMSQVSTGITGNLQFYDFVNAEIANAVEKGASPKELISYINEKLKLTKVAKGLKAKGLPAQISSLEEFQTLLVPLNFEQRGSFNQTFLSKDSYDQFGISPFAPLKTVPTNLQDVVNDPSLRNVKYGDIVSAIEFDQGGKPFKLNEGDPGYHPAYPWALPGKPMMVFNNAVDVRKVYPKAKPKGEKTNQTPIGKRTKPLAARSAMGGQYVAKVPKDINVEGAPIKEKAQKASVDKLAKMYQMKSNGIIWPQGVDPNALNAWANALGFTVERTRGDKGQTTSYKLKKDGKTYKPTREKAQRNVDEKSQKTFNKFDTPLEIINSARELNFTDAAILDYLTRVRKFTKTEVRELMKINADLLSVIPPSLGNIKGGMKAGVKLFQKVSNFYNKLQTKNAKAKVKLTEQEMMDEAMEFLREQAGYKSVAEPGIKGMSTEQSILMIDIARALGGRQSTNLNQAIRNARIILKAKTKGQKQLKKVQRELRNFMRKTLPKDIYTKQEALKLMRKIEQANNDNIQEIMNEVMEFAAEKNNVRLEASIQELLDPKKTVKKINNILKGVKIDEDTRKRIASIKKRIEKGIKTTEDEVVKYIAELQQEYNEINEKPVKLEGDYTAMADLQIVMNMVSASNLMGNNDLTKVNVLARVEAELKQMIVTGRTMLKDQLQEAHLEYRRQFEEVYKDITGRRESFRDQALNELQEAGIKKPTEAEIQDKITDIIENIKEQLPEDRQYAQNKDAIRGRGKKLIDGVFRTLGNIMNKHSDLFLIMDKISKLPADLFEGVTQKEVTDRVDKASRLFKERMLMNEALIIFKYQELFGKKYKKIVGSFTNKVPNVIFRDAKKVQDAEAAYKKNPTAENNTKLEQEILRQGIGLSPNQMYYLYNQYKDSQNHPGFEAQFGPDYQRVMKDITTELETNYPELKEFADWQVDVLYPSLYNHYNEAYQDIYRTQMPYNVNYAGMVYRDGVEPEGVDLLSGSTQYHNVVAANSTKMRENNKRPIKAMDGTDALFTYMRDMEYFSAYARPVNDINKLFTNPIIKETIENLYGGNVNEMIEAAIQKLANKGMFKSNVRFDSYVNIMQDLFITSRLGINPVVTLKQLTSFITYANDIGFVNWIKNAAIGRLGKGQSVSAVWKEIAENSVYMQDRDARSITKALEMYTDKRLGDKDWIRSATGLRADQRESLVDALMYTTRLGDRGAIYLGGVPNYVYYKNQALEAGKTEQEAIDIAIRKWERDTKRTQQSTDLQDRDYYQTQDAYMRAINMFLTTPKQYLRKEAYAMRNFYKLLKSGGKEGKGTKMQNARTFFTYHVVMPMFFQYVANGFPGLLAEWDDEDEKDLARAAILGNVNALLILGEVAVNLGHLATGKPLSFIGFKNLPVITQFEEVFKNLYKWLNTKDPAKKEEAGFKALMELSQFTGMPVRNISKIFDNLEKLAEGGEDPAKIIMRLFNFSEYQIQSEAERKRNKKSKRNAKKKVRKEIEDNTIFKDSRDNDNTIFKKGKKNDNRIFK